jgi:hypothetical protein
MVGAAQRRSSSSSPAGRWSPRRGGAGRCGLAALEIVARRCCSALDRGGTGTALAPWQGRPVCSASFRAGIQAQRLFHCRRRVVRF